MATKRNNRKRSAKDRKHGKPRAMTLEQLSSREMLAGDLVQVNDPSDFSATDSFSGSDFDLYQIEVAQDSRLVAATSQPNGAAAVDTYLRLFDTDGNEVNRNDDGGSGYYSLIDHVFHAGGTYFLGVSGYGNSDYDALSPESGQDTYHAGAYQITITVEEHVVDPNADFDTVDVDTSQPFDAIGNVSGASFDLYRFEAAAGSRLVAETSQPSGADAIDTYLRLFDANGNEVTRNDDDGAGYYSRIDHEISAGGSYFLGVSGYGNSSYHALDPTSGQHSRHEGAYQINITVDTDWTPDPDVDFDPIVVDTSQPFHATGNLGEAEFNLYRLDVTAGSRLSAETSQPSGATATDTYLRLFDGDGTEIARNDDGGVGYYSRIDHVFTAGGTYYLGVSGYGNSSYDPFRADSGRVGRQGAYGLSVASDGNTTNTAPELAALNDLRIAKNSGPLTVELTATDADGDALTFSVDSDGIEAEIVDGQLVVTPLTGVAGEFSVVVSVTDGDDTATQSFTVEVFNHAPILEAFANRSLALGEQLTVDLLAMDLNGDELSYRVDAADIASGAEAAVDVDVTHDEIVLRRRAGYEGAFTVTVTASDGDDEVQSNFEVHRSLNVTPELDNGLNLIEGGLNLTNILDIDLNSDVVAYDYRTDGTFTFNAFTGGVFGEIDLGSGVSLDTAQIEELLQGVLTVPRINAAEALVAAFGVRMVESNNYNQVRQGLQEAFGGENVYFSSERFTNWASLERLAGSIGKVIASGGALTEDVLAEAVEQFELEFQDLYAWVSAKAEADYPELAQALFEALVFQHNVENPYVAVNWSPVDYRYEPQLAGTASAINGALGQVSDVVNEAALESRHLGFSVVWKNPQSEGIIRQRLEDFEGQQLQGENGFRSFLPSLSQLQQFRDQSQLADAAIERFAAIGQGAETVQRELSRIVSQQLRVADALPQQLADASNPVIDLRDSALGDNFANLLDQLAQGNEGGIDVDTLEFDLLTMDLKAEFSIRHRHVWGTPEEILNAVGDRIGQVIDEKIAEISDWLDERVGALNEWEQEQLDNLDNALPDWAQARIRELQDGLAQAIADARENADRDIENAQTSVNDALERLDQVLQDERDQAVDAFENAVADLEESVSQELDNALRELDSQIDALRDEVAEGLASVDQAFQDRVAELTHWAEDGLAASTNELNNLVDQWQDWLDENVEIWTDWLDGNVAPWEEWLDNAIAGTYQGAVDWLDIEWDTALDAAYDQYSDAFHEWAVWIDDSLDAAWNTYSDAWDSWQTWANSEFDSAWSQYSAAWDEWENWLSNAISSTYEQAEDWLRSTGNSGWEFIQDVFGFGLIGTDWLDLPNWSSLPGWAQDRINGYINQFNAGVQAWGDWHDNRVAEVQTTLDNGLADWSRWYDERAASLNSTYQNGIDDWNAWYDNRVASLRGQFENAIQQLNGAINAGGEWSSLPSWNALPGWAQDHINGYLAQYNEAVAGFEAQFRDGLAGLESQFHAAVDPLRDELAGLAEHWANLLADALEDARAEYDSDRGGWNDYLNERLEVLNGEIGNVRDHWQRELAAGMASLEQVRNDAIATAEQAFDDGQIALEEGLEGVWESIENAFLEIRDGLAHTAQDAIDAIREEAMRQIGLDADAIRDAAEEQRNHARNMASGQIDMQGRIAELVADPDSLQRAIAVHGHGAFWLADDGSQAQTMEMLSANIHRSVTSHVANEYMEQADPALVQQLQADLDNYLTSFQDHFASLSAAEQQEMRDTFMASVSPDGFALTAGDFVHSVSDLLSFNFAPGGIGVDSSNVIAQRLDALLGNTFETIRQIFPAISADVAQAVFDFADGLEQAGVLIRDGQVDQGFGQLVSSIGLFARDVSGITATSVVNTVNNVVSGVIFGTLFGRPLSYEEREFAHEIFGDKINLTSVQIVEAGFGSGMVAGRTIYMADMDLDDDFSRKRFAHELTHVHQDQQMPGNQGTQRATKELLSWMWGAGLEDSPYDVTLNANSNWSDLGAEQQAQAVEDYQLHLDVLAGLSSRVDPTNGSLAHYESVLEQAGFFRWS